MRDLIDFAKDHGIDIIQIDIGDTVLCDDCSKDFTESDMTGGLLFQSKAIGPCCADKWIRNAHLYNETKFILDLCPPDKSFANWVRSIR